MTTGRINQVVAALLSRIKPHSNAQLVKVTFTACSCSALLHTILISSKTAVNQKYKIYRHPYNAGTSVLKANPRTTNNCNKLQQKKAADSQHALLAAHCILTLFTTTKMPHNSISANNAHSKNMYTVPAPISQV